MRLNLRAHRVAERQGRRFAVVTSAPVHEVARPVDSVRGLETHATLADALIAVQSPRSRRAYGV